MDALNSGEKKYTSRSQVTEDDSALASQEASTESTYSTLPAHTILADSNNVQFLKTEAGSHTGTMYRIVQVPSNATDSETAAILQTQYSGGEEVEADNGESGQCAAGSEGGSGGSTQELVTSAEVMPGYFLVTSDQTVLQTGGGQRNIVPKVYASPVSIGGIRAPRDVKRRSVHNEVERRRRDKINLWIAKLAHIVPDCQQDHTKQGQSKGGILSKTCDYIEDLRHERQELRERVKELERQVTVLGGGGHSGGHGGGHVDSVTQQLKMTQSENESLRAVLRERGIIVTTSTNSPS